MSSIPYDLKKIKAFLFDVDGVLSTLITTIGPDGTPLRTANARDGYAIKLAVERGFHLGVITGGDNTLTKMRMNYLGVHDFYNLSRNKLRDYTEFKDKYALRDEEIVYIGDDIPDIPVLTHCGLSVAPMDAAPEVMHVSTYISPKRGGEGVVREVIEQTLLAQNLWHTRDILLDW